MNRFARIAITWFGVTVGVLFGGWAALVVDDRRARQKQARKTGAAMSPGTCGRSACGRRSA